MLDEVGRERGTWSTLLKAGVCWKQTIRTTFCLTVLINVLNDEMWAMRGCDKTHKGKRFTFCHFPLLSNQYSFPLPDPEVLYWIFRTVKFVDFALCLFGVKCSQKMGNKVVCVSSLSHPWQKWQALSAPKLSYAPVVGPSDISLSPQWKRGEKWQPARAAAVFLWGAQIFRRWIGKTVLWNSEIASAASEEAHLSTGYWESDCDNEVIKRWQWGIPANGKQHPGGRPSAVNSDLLRVRAGWFTVSDIVGSTVISYWVHTTQLSCNSGGRCLMRKRNCGSLVQNTFDDNTKLNLRAGLSLFLIKVFSFSCN